MAAAPPPDSPLVRRFAAAAIALAALAILLAAVRAPADAVAAAVLAAVMLAAAAALLRRSRRSGEPAEHERLLDTVGFAGEEDVLALGDARLARAAASHLPGGRAEHGGFAGSRLPFGSGSFDAVVTALALHPLPDRRAREQACTEIARVLRPGGRVALLEYFRLAHELELALEDAGLQEVRRSGLRRRVFPPARRLSARRPARRVD